MRKLLAVLGLSVGAVALAQAVLPRGFSSTGYPAVSADQLVTQAATTYYVDVDGGSDSYACTSSSAPCLTIDGALGKVPKNIAHPTNVQVARGDYGAFTMTGFAVRTPATTSSTANYLAVTGTLVTPTVSSDGGVLHGATSGTLSSATSLSGATFPTYSQADAGWVVNELSGYLLEVLTGTGSVVLPTAYVIVSNTSTTITAVGASSAANATYAIRDWGTRIITASASTSNGPPYASTSGESTFGARVQNNSGGANGNLLHLTRLAFTGDSTNGAVQVKSSGRVNVTTVKVDDTGSGVIGAVGINATDGSGVFISGLYCRVQSLGACIVANTTNLTAAGIGITRSWFAGGSTQVTLVGASSLATSYFTGSSFAAINLGAQGGGAAVQITGLRIDGGARGINIGNSTSGGNIAQFGCTSANISNTTVGGIIMATSTATGNITSVAGTGNLVGIALTDGAHLKIGSGATITGTTEISVDGTGSTLTAMRGNTPKTLPATASQSPYGTVAFE